MARTKQTARLEKPRKGAKTIPQTQVHQTDREQLIVSPITAKIYATFLETYNENIEKSELVIQEIKKQLPKISAESQRKIETTTVGSIKPGNIHSIAPTVAVQKNISDYESIFILQNKFVSSVYVYDKALYDRITKIHIDGKQEQINITNETIYNALLHEACCLTPDNTLIVYNFDGKSVEVYDLENITEQSIFTFSLNVSEFQETDNVVITCCDTFPFFAIGFIVNETKKIYVTIIDYFCKYSIQNIIYQFEDYVSNFQFVGGQETYPKLLIMFHTTHIIIPFDILKIPLDNWIWIDHYNANGIDIQLQNKQFIALYTQHLQQKESELQEHYFKVHDDMNEVPIQGLYHYDQHSDAFAISKIVNNILYVTFYSKGRMYVYYVYSFNATVLLSINVLHDTIVFMTYQIINSGPGIQTDIYLKYDVCTVNDNQRKIISRKSLLKSSGVFAISQFSKNVYKCINSDKIHGGTLNEYLEYLSRSESRESGETLYKIIECLNTKALILFYNNSNITMLDLQKIRKW